MHFREPDADHPATHSLTLSHDNHMLVITYQHALEHDGRRLFVDASVRMSRPPHGSVWEIDADPPSVSWVDRMRWDRSLERKDITFSLDTHKLVVTLGLDFAAPSYYVLRVEVATITLLDAPAGISKDQVRSFADDQTYERESGVEPKESQGAACGMAVVDITTRLIKKVKGIARRNMA